MNTNRPAHEIRLGNIRATIWPNQKDQKTWHAVTIARRYRQGTEWKETTSFNHNDLPLVAQVAQMACSWICEHQGVTENQEEA